MDIIDIVHSSSVVRLSVCLFFDAMKDVRGFNLPCSISVYDLICKFVYADTCA